MYRKPVLPETDLNPHLRQYDGPGITPRIKALYNQQKEAWTEFRYGYDAMRAAKTRRIDLGPCWVVCRFMPHRMASVSARVDPVSVGKRPCFLCGENLYPQERGIEYATDYLILCNVSPIFDFHLVITHRNHVPQAIQPHFETAIQLTHDISPEFVLIYNGPRCGASAPDHLHFQVFPAHALPLGCQVWRNHARAVHKPIVKTDGIVITAPDGFLRHFLIFESGDPAILSTWFQQTLGVLAGFEMEPGEPMINLLMAYRDDRWTIILFPREKHRPECYYGKQGEQLLISPGVIDMAGVFVIPRERDYHAVDAAILRGVYQEVTLRADRFSLLRKTLMKSV